MPPLATARNHPHSAEIGQSMVEYVVLVALVAIALIVSTQELGSSVSDAFTRTAASLAASDAAP